VTALNPHIGYEKAAQITIKAYREDISPRDDAMELGVRHPPISSTNGCARRI
jgi:fumarate hydratase class II